MRLLKERYKTILGARNRAAFENAMALGEFRRGDKARIYSYATVKDKTGAYRVERRP